MHSIRACRLVATLTLVAVVATVPDPLVAQSGALPNAPGVWKPWKPFSAIASARQEQAATPALVKAFEGEMLALNEILRRASGVASPDGFSVETWGNLDGYRLAEDAPGQPAGIALPLSGALTFGAFPIYEIVRNGKTIRVDTGETALQQFHINQIRPGLIDRGNVTEWIGVDTDAFHKPMPQGEVAGLPRYGDGLIIARDPAALWTPLPQKAALDLVAKARQKTVSELEESLSKSTARLAVVRDPAYRAKRIKEGLPAEALAAEETQLANELSPTGGGTGKSLADAKRALSEVTDWIAELSPAQQAAASCYAAKGATLRAKFPTTPSADCHPLVRPNYAYFNKTLPRSAPQVVVITGTSRCFDTADKYNRDANSTSPAGCRANRALVETMDKSAIRAWLR
jgi:hypothetical protein